MKNIKAKELNCINKCSNEKETKKCVDNVQTQLSTWISYKTMYEINKNKNTEECQTKL